MSETAFALIENGIPNSFDLDANPLTDRGLSQWLEDGYAGRVAVVPRQALGISATETMVEDSKPTNDLTSTVFRSSDTDIIQLPVAVPENPHWKTTHALQEWEGWVIEKGEEEFTARLLDLTAVDSDPRLGWTQEEEAIIPYSEISEDDLSRLRPGSVFRWIIGYERSATGTKRRISQIIFRDLPAMTKHDMSFGEEWAEKIARAFQD